MPGDVIARTLGKPRYREGRNGRRWIHFRNLLLTRPCNLLNGSIQRTGKLIHLRLHLG